LAGATRTTGQAADPADTQATASTDAMETAQPEDLSGLLFDQALDELRDIVARLEDGGLPLEGSIALYERGAALHEHCARLLDVAESRIGRLVDGPGGAPRLMDLRPDDADDL
jgi:exodeoxyribonuclease VII small subunit